MVQYSDFNSVEKDKQTTVQFISKRTTICFHADKNVRFNL